MLRQQPRAATSVHDLRVAARRSDAALQGQADQRRRAVLDPVQGFVEALGNAVEHACHERIFGAPRDILERAGRQHVLGDGIIGFDAQPRLIVVRCLVGAAQPVQDLTEAPEALRFGLQCQRFPQRLDCIVQALASPYRPRRARSNARGSGAPVRSRGGTHRRIAPGARAWRSAMPRLRKASG